MLDSYISNKIKWLSFIAVSMVVVIHTGFHIRQLPGLVPVITQWAVPFFLIISGAFFYYSLEKYGVVQLLKIKCCSLLVPYLIWGLYGTIVLGTWGLNSLGLLESYPAGNQPLWFIKALLILMLCIIIVYKPLSIGLGAHVWVKWCTSFVVFIGVSIANKFYSVILMPSCHFYFLLGFILSSYILEGRKMIVKRGLILVVLGVIGIICLRYFGGESIYMRHTCNLLMIIVLWFGWDVATGRREIGEPKWMQRTFAVYCIHYPPLVLLCQYLPSWLLCLLYPLICFGITESLYRLSPKTARFVFGGR